MDSNQIEELAAKARDGDAEALSALCEKKSRAILYHTLQYFGNRCDAQDAAQEALIRICLNIGSLKDPGYFNGWAHKIVLNTCREVQRKRYVSEGRYEAEAREIDLIETDRDVIPHAHAEDADGREAILRIVAGLPAKRREAILMYYYDGMSHAEIAEAMGVSQSTVSTNIMRARNTIRKAYERYEKKVKDSRETVRGGKGVRYGEKAEAGVFALLPGAFRAEASRLISDTDVGMLMDAVKPVITGVRVSGSIACATHTGAGYAAVSPIVKTILFAAISTALVSAGAAAVAGQGAVVREAAYAPVAEDAGDAKDARETGDAGDEMPAPVTPGGVTVTEVVTEEEVAPAEFPVSTDPDVAESIPRTSAGADPAPADQGYLLTPRPDPQPDHDEDISFLGGDCSCGHVNPERAVVRDLPDGARVYWNVTREDGHTVIFEEEGPIVAIGVRGLEKGSYVLHARVTDAAGHAWEIAKEFLVQQI
ncbi:MAG: sigma-70 family RNA polymerase sigma factor [Clostridiales Family XIII bacterium]|jgi:RNA polymerase sigma-70 factor (ECF subfamily)|nr:sigma-70 family RNA polymerase sigma factor [Clostridiales Family XIII bacterium]